MRVQVRLFAAYREIAGADLLELELAAGATAAQAWQRLQQEHPALVNLQPSAALDAQIVSLDAPLSDGAELAFLPPVSGG